MVDQVAIVTVDGPASNSAVNFTSSEITETVKAVVFIYGATLTDASTTTHGCLGISMWADDGESNSPGTEFFQSHYFRCLDSSTSDCRGFKDADSLQTIENDGGPANNMNADTVTPIAGGVQVNLSVTTSRSRITAIIFAGVARTWVSSPTINTSSNHETTGGASEEFQPDVLIFAGTVGAFGGLLDDFRAQMGFVIQSSGAQVGASIDIDRGTNPTRADGIVDASRVPCLINGSSGGLQRVNITIDSTGYNTIVNAGVVVSTVLAIKFSGAFRAVCDNFAISSSTGLQSFALGIKPRVAIGISTFVTAEDVVENGSTAAGVGFFAFTDKAARAFTARNTVTATPSSATSLQGDYALATLATDGSVGQRATLSSTSSSGFVLNFTEATTGYMSVLGIEFGQNIVLPIRRLSRPRRARLSRMRYRAIGGLLGVAAAQGAGLVLRAIQRARRQMQARLRPRRTFWPTTTQNTTPSATDQDPEGAVFAAGAERGSVFCGGAEEATVL